MRHLFFLVTLFLFISCVQTENCDLKYYPNPPYGNPDDTIHSDNSIRYSYFCYTSSFNRIVTYEIVGECWEMYIDEDYNLNYN